MRGKRKETRLGENLIDIFWIHSNNLKIDQIQQKISSIISWFLGFLNVVGYLIYFFLNIEPKKVSWYFLIFITLNITILIIAPLISRGLKILNKKSREQVKTRLIKQLSKQNVKKYLHKFIASDSIVSNREYTNENLRLFIQNFYHKFSRSSTIKETNLMDLYNSISK